MWVADVGHVIVDHVLILVPIVSFLRIQYVHALVPCRAWLVYGAHCPQRIAEAPESNVVWSQIFINGKEKRIHRTMRDVLVRENPHPFLAKG